MSFKKYYYADRVNAYECAGHIEHMGKMRNTLQNFGRKAEEKRQVGRHRRR
jgi:hypothetical protein